MFVEELQVMDGVIFNSTHTEERKSDQLVHNSNALRLGEEFFRVKTALSRVLKHYCQLLTKL